MTQMTNRPELLQYRPTDPGLLRGLHALAEQYGFNTVRDAIDLAGAFTLADCPDCALPDHGHCRRCDSAGDVPAATDWDALIAAAEERS